MAESKNTPLPILSGVEFPPEKLEMKALGDLLYHEGPLLSHLMNEEKENYLMLWCGQDNTYNRWLLSKTTFALLHQYFEKKITLRHLILSNPDGFVFFVDIDNDIEWRRAILVENFNIRPGNLPGEKSWFDARSFEDYAYQLKSDIAIQFSKPEKKYKPIAELETSLAMEPQAPPYRKVK